MGLTVYAWYDCTEEEYFNFLNKALDHKPHIIIDDGGDLVNLLHTTRQDAKERLLGGSEETTTGVHRLYALENAKPVSYTHLSAIISSFVETLNFDKVVTYIGNTIIGGTEATPAVGCLLYTSRCV